MVRLCTEILPTGSQCKGIALKNQPWCRGHATPEKRERNADSRQIVAMIRDSDVFMVAGILQNTIYELRAKLVPPLHAKAIIDAAMDRLDYLKEEPWLAEEHARLTAHFGQTNNPNQNNRLHVVPMK
jgi:hypothetical protein